VCGEGGQWGDMEEQDNVVEGESECRGSAEGKWGERCVQALRGQKMGRCL